MPRCLVSVPDLGAARTYTLEGDTISALKDAVGACPVLGGKFDMASYSFQAAVTSAIAGEDEASFIMHTQSLMAECRKASPDECQMLERMSLTSRHRISDISASTVKEAMERYPYLMNFERVVSLDDIQTVAVVRILSANAKKLNGLSALFVQEEDLSVPATPCIVFTGQEIEEADFLYLEVDCEKLFRVKNAEEGLAAVLSAYWLFNVQYERKLFNTLLVLERLFLGLALTTPRVVAAKFLNKNAKSV
ncbi:uncharacterized protein LOC144102768 [Amblyomma americanum]